MAALIDDLILAGATAGAQGTIDIGSSWLGNYFNRQAASKQAAQNWQIAYWQWKKNSEEAQKNRDWQERMSNTAHRREVADLRAAGLNPVLSATGGNGASSPSGSMASVSASAPDMSALANTGRAFANVGKDAVSKALRAVQLRSEIQLMESNASNAKAQAANTWENVLYTKANTAKVLAEAGVFQSQLDRIEWLKKNSPNTWYLWGDRDPSLWQLLPGFSRGTESTTSNVGSALSNGVKKVYNAIKNFGVNNANSIVNQFTGNNLGDKNTSDNSRKAKIDYNHPPRGRKSRNKNLPLSYTRNKY